MPRPRLTPADVRVVFDKLSAQHPNADTELHFTTPYELLVATILSAQTTDERVNQVTPALFDRYPDAHALAGATTAELEPRIQSTGFFRAKSRALLGMAAEVVSRHGGEIPRTMEELVKLPGVGRKTANVVLGHALGVPGLPVDRHVLRVANRIGIARSEAPEVVEQQLCAVLPPTDWTRASDTLILHGRRICRPRPLCDRCVVRGHCWYYRTVVGAAAGAARPRAAKPSKSLTVPRKRAAATPRGPDRGDGQTDRAARGRSPEEHRAARPRGTGAVDGIGESEPDARGRLPQERRAAKPRGTGRGGGAPRHRNK